MARRKKVSVKVKKQLPIKTTKTDEEQLKELEAQQKLSKNTAKTARKPRKKAPPKSSTIRRSRSTKQPAEQLNVQKTKYNIGEASHQRAVDRRLAQGYPIEIASLSATEFKKWAREWDTEANYTKDEIITILSSNAPLPGESREDFTKRQQAKEEQPTTPSEEVLSESDTAELMFRQIMSNIETASLYLGGKYSHEGIDAIRFFVQGGYYEFGAPFIKQLTELPEFANLASAKEIYDSSKSPGYAFALVETLSSKIGVFNATTSLEPFGMLYEDEDEE